MFSGKTIQYCTFFVQRSAVRTQVLLMVPGQVPAFSRSHTTAFTPNACHTHLKKKSGKLHSGMTKEFIQTCEEFIQIIPRDFCSSVVSGMLAPNRTDGRMCGTFCIATQAEKNPKKKKTNQTRTTTKNS